MTNQELLQLLRSEVIPAIGCTEPIAVALCVARAKELLGAEPDEIDVYLSKNVYKNALAVGIPNTGMTGLPIAIALGATIGKSEYMLEVLRDATPEAVIYAKKYMLRVPAQLHINYEAPSILYIHAKVRKGDLTAQATIMDEHTNFVEEDEVLKQKGNEAIRQKNNDGEEHSFTSVHTYEYEEHGLLISEVDMIGEKFMSMTVYSYEAILVPQT